MEDNLHERREEAKNDAFQFKINKVLYYMRLKRHIN